MSSTALALRRGQQSSHEAKACRLHDPGVVTGSQAPGPLVTAATPGRLRLDDATPLHKSAGMLNLANRKRVKAISVLPDRELPERIR